MRLFSGDFGFRRTSNMIMQTEASECGLACIAMIATHYNFHIDLPSLRARHPISSKGVTLANIMKIGVDLKLVARPVKLDLHQISRLSLPCILHWNFNHFVVLKSIKKSTFIICDPAIGVREVSMNEMSNCFTGVAMEFWPGADFIVSRPVPAVRIQDLVGSVSGISKSFMQVMVVAIALETTAALSPLFLQWLVDEVIPGQDRQLLWTLTLAFGALVVVQQLLTTMRSWLILFLNTNFSKQWRINIFNHLIRLPVQYFEKRHLGDVMSRFGSVEQIQNVLTSAFIEGVLDGLMTIFTLAMMFLYSPSLGICAVIAMSLYALMRCVLYHPQHLAISEQIGHTAKVQSYFLETLRGIKTIKLFQRLDDRRFSWTSLLIDQLNSELRTNKLHIIFKSFNGILFGLNNIIVLALGTNFVLEQKISIGALMAFTAYKMQFDGRVTALIDKYWDFKMLRVHCERLADIAMTEPEQDGEDSFEIFSTQPVLGIVVDGLRFRYSIQEPYVLNEVSFKVAPGESVAVVGPSGCGKTTLMNILLGVITSFEGSVVIGGVNATDMSRATLRRIVGSVLQDDVLFNGSLSENITFFDPLPDLEWMRQCAVMAAVDSEIELMPMKYNTLVGDMGSILSGGQKQRVLLARALYKRPSILFLDEATSHLDVFKEREVNEAIKKLNITRVIIAHRPETIASADRVVHLGELERAGIGALTNR